MVVFGILLMTWIAASTLGATRERSVWEGVYTDSQAQEGEGVFVRACAECHAAVPGQTAGDGSAATLIGGDFRFRWIGSSIAYLFDTIRQTMPEAAPNSLSPREYAVVTAYLLKLNGYPAGTVELDPAKREILEQIFIDDGQED